MLTFLIPLIQVGSRLTHDSRFLGEFQKWKVFFTSPKFSACQRLRKHGTVKQSLCVCLETRLCLLALLKLSDVHFHAETTLCFVWQRFLSFSFLSLHYWGNFQNLHINHLYTCWCSSVAWKLSSFPGSCDSETLSADSSANMHLLKPYDKILHIFLLIPFGRLNKTHKKECGYVCVSVSVYVSWSQKSLCTSTVKHQQRSSCQLTEQLIHTEGSSSKQLQRNTSFKFATYHHHRSKTGSVGLFVRRSLGGAQLHSHCSL